MKRLLWILFISNIFMFGCSPDKEPDGRIKNIQESTWTKSVAELYIFSKVDRENDQTIAILDKFCWEREEEDNCDLSPSDPRIIIENDITSLAPLIVKKGETVILHHDYLTVGIPKPDEFSVTQYSANDDIGVQIDVIEERPEHHRPKIIIPDESGKYFYNVHIQWHEEAVGEVYYAFFLHVKEDS